jgi:hypothetical protein
MCESSVSGSRGALSNLPKEAVDASHHVAEVTAALHPIHARFSRPIGKLGVRAHAHPHGFAPLVRYLHDVLDAFQNLRVPRLPYATQGVR